MEQDFKQVRTMSILECPVFFPLSAHLLADLAGFVSGIEL